MALKKPKDFSSTIPALIIVNLIPIIGVVYFKWSVAGVILLYIFESFILGLFNILKIIMAGTDKKGPNCANFFMAGFFTIHYNGFIALQFFFILDLISGLEKNTSTQDTSSFEIVPGLTLVGLAYLFVFLSQLFFFIKSYIVDGEYKYTNIGHQMVSPYMRVFVQQFLALGGGYFLASSGNKSMALLVFLVVLKTVFDFLGYLLERNQYNKIKKQFEENKGNG